MRRRGLLVELVQHGRYKFAVNCIELEEIMAGKMIDSKACILFFPVNSTRFALETNGMFLEGRFDVDEKQIPAESISWIFLRIVGAILKRCSLEYLNSKI